MKILAVNTLIAGYHIDLTFPLVGASRIMMGNLNSHDKLWETNLVDNQRGLALVEYIDDSTFCTVNYDAPTRILDTYTSSSDIKIFNVL